MKYKNPLLVVKDIERSVVWYKKVLGLNKTVDFGANVTLTGGLSLQSEDSWLCFTGKNATYYCNNAEMYFEEDDFDKFIEKLSNIGDINYVHHAVESSWGQRAVRFYDPDGHIIEVGENMKAVCKRFLDEGMTPERIAVRMDVPLKNVKAMMR